MTNANRLLCSSQTESRHDTLTHENDLRSVVLCAVLSPYGFPIASVLTSHLKQYSRHPRTDAHSPFASMAGLLLAHSSLLRQLTGPKITSLRTFASQSQSSREAPSSPPCYATTLHAMRHGVANSNIQRPLQSDYTVFAILLYQFPLAIVAACVQHAVLGPQLGCTALHSIIAA